MAAQETETECADCKYEVIPPRFGTGVATTNAEKKARTDELKLGFKCSKCDGSAGTISLDPIQPGKGYCSVNSCYDIDQLRKAVRVNGKNPTTREPMIPAQVEARWNQGDRCTRKRKIDIRVKDDVQYTNQCTGERKYDPEGLEFTQILRDIKANIVRGIFLSGVLYLLWISNYDERFARGWEEKGGRSEGVIIIVVGILLEPFNRLLTYFRKIWDAKKPWFNKYSQFGGGESRFGVRTFLINKIMMFLKPVINILLDKIVSLTDDQLDYTSEFISDLVSADKLDEFDEFLTKYKTMSLAKRKMWVAPNSVNELFRTILQKAFKNADRQADRQVKKDYTERGCTCKADGEKGFNYLTRKSWCEIEDPEGHGVCVQASKHRCEGWDEEEDTCYGYYWDYIH